MESGKSETLGASTPAPSIRTTVRRGAARADYDPESVRSVVDAAPICHVGVGTSREPLVLPMAHGRIGDTLYLHGGLDDTVLGTDRFGARPIPEPFRGIVDHGYREDQSSRTPRAG